MTRINEKLGSRVFSIVEMPGNFVKKGESERLELAKWSMLVNRHPNLTHNRRAIMTHLWVKGLIPMGPHGGPPGR